MKKLILLFLLVHFLWTGNVSSQCLPEGITFTVQSQIDNFQMDYPGCTKILGDVTILESYSGAISNLNGLSILNSIDGTLEINQNNGLTDLSGLNNLDSIGGDLKIGLCHSLTNLNGLQNLSFVGGGLILWYDELVSNLDSLENLCFIGDYLIIGGLESLSSLYGLGNIDTIGYLEIYQNASLTNLIGLEKLSVIEGNFKLDHNDSLINLSGLDSLNSIEGYFRIENNYYLTNLNGLENLTNIGGDLVIGTYFGGHLYLTSLTGLESLTTIGGSLSITHNDSLQTISSLNNLVSIGYDLSVYYNYSLKSIDSLWNLDSIGGVLGIGYNYSLQDINSLANIESGSISALYINNNTVLSECDINSICEFISTPDATTSIHDNASGCNSREEVKHACLVGEFPLPAHGIHISIYPNPTTSTFNYLATDLDIIEINIYNNLGQKVLTEFRPDNTIDISSINPGLYIVEFITSKKYRFKKKLIIK